MNKEILLLENKIDRENINQDKLKKLAESSVLEIVFGDNNCNDLLNKFMDDSEQFNQYSTIIIHASIYTIEKREKLFDRLKVQKEKNIVIFSGEGSTISLNTNSFILPAKVLYSHNLEIFVREPNRNILMLGYGKNWKINILLNILEKLNLFIDKNILEKYNFDNFEDEIKLLDLKNIMDDDSYDDFINQDPYKDDINKNKIQQIQQKIYKYIEESL